MTTDTPAGAAPATPLSPEEQLVRDYDLYLVDLHDEMPSLIPQRDAMRTAWLKGDFEVYQQAFEAARESGVIADNGKPLYVQYRIGRGGKVFKCWKVRTMVQNAEKVRCIVIPSA